MDINAVALDLAIPSQVPPVVDIVSDVAGAKSEQATAAEKQCDPSKKEAPTNENDVASETGSVAMEDSSSVQSLKKGGVLARRRAKIEARNKTLGITSLGKPLDLDDSILEEASAECLADKLPKTSAVTPEGENPSTRTTDATRCDTVHKTDVDSIDVLSIDDHAAAVGDKINMKRGYFRLDKAKIVRVVNLGILLWIAGINGK